MGLFLESIRGHPILVWGSPYRFGDPQTKTGIPEPKWGCASNESPNRFGDPQTKMGIKTSPYQNGDPRTKMGMHRTMNPQTDSGIPKPKWGSRHPHTKTGIPESVWGLFSHEPIAVWGSFQFGTLGFRPQIGTAFKMGTPYRNGDPRIGMGRDMSIFQIGESP
jgi:hypothetical protein